MKRSGQRAPLEPEGRHSNRCSPESSLREVAPVLTSPGLSADRCVFRPTTHALHPNYPDRHDHGHAPQVNKGPAIKLNVNQRYATSSTTAQRYAAICERAGLPTQVFSSKNNIPCGSTIGPITATRLGIDTIDVGVPQLSMHSARTLWG